MSNEKHDGGCLCGAVRYEVTGPIDRIAHCHCSMCRGSAGAPVVTFFVVEASRFRFTQGTPRIYRSSRDAERRFCGTCGTQLTFASRRSPDYVDVTLASLDHPERHAPKHHVWTSAQLPWLKLDEHLPGYPEFTPTDKL